MTEITQEIRDDVEEIVYDFYAEECEVDIESINNDTNIIEDLEGDSLMFLELVEIFKKKYNVEITLQSIGEYLLNHPAETIGKVIDLVLLIIKYGEKIAELE